MAEEKMNIIDQFYYAMFKPKFYNKLSKLKPFNVVLYTIILIVFTTIIKMGFPIAAWIANQGGLNTVIMDKIPAFTIESNEFDIEEPFNTTIGGVTILADSTIGTYSIDDLSEDQMLSAFCLGKDSLLIVTAGSGIAFKWSDLLVDGFSNQMLASYIPVIYVYIAICLLFTMLLEGIKYVIVAFLFAIIGYNFSKFLKADLSYMKVFELALYAQTLGHVATTITAVVCGTMVNMIMSFVSVLATAFILNGGIMSHKGDGTINIDIQL